MRIEGISAGSAPGLGGGAQTTDATSKSLQQQIENAQKQMQELAKNDQMSPEDKMKKRQELQKQITDLNQQLRQHEIELKRKQAEEAREKREREAQERSAGKQEKEGEQRGAISKDSMSSIISADSAVKQANADGRIKTKMEGEKRVLEGEIRQDKSRGVDTSKKEEKLSDMEKRIRDVTGAQIKTLAGADKKLEDTARKENEKKAEKDGKAKEDRALAQGGAMKSDAGAGMLVDEKTAEEELAQKIKKEHTPGQVIDERL